MSEAVVVTVLVVFLAVIAVAATARRRQARREVEALVQRAGPDGAWLDLAAPHAALGSSLESLFRDEDYRWLRAQPGLEAAARQLKRRRIRLARTYLQRLDGDFRRLLALHGLLARDGRAGAEAQDQVAALAIRFQARIWAARCLLPLSHVSLRLEPLRALSQAASAWPELARQAAPLPVR